MKLCVIYNFAAHYRAPVFVEIDQSFDCDWYFGKSNDDIKKMDYSLLRGCVTELDNKRLLGGNWQKGVLRLLRRKEYGTYLVFAQTKDFSTWVLGLTARLFHPKKKVFFWSHGLYGKETFMERIIKKTLFKLPNCGTFLYGSYARGLMIKEGLDPNKLFVIHNSLAYDEQVAIRKQLTVKPIYQEHFNNNYPNLFFVGRLTSVKKLDMILKAMKRLENKGQYYNLTFVGSGEKRKDLESLTGELKLEKRVWFFGPCYDENVLGELIYNADLCVSPGNVGLTAMHTMVFGTPVLTHDDFPHQMPEFEAIQEGKTGAFFKYAEVDDLVDKISGWFFKMGNRREDVRVACMNEIDVNWTPQFQIEVLKKHLQ
ncbi:MAG: glycosyltransferase family 4 protein [Bacteroidales bacterium]|nr:glycosyltransferase family 4 protein [Bacteroidales bacterium]